MTLLTAHNKTFSLRFTTIDEYRNALTAGRYGGAEDIEELKPSIRKTKRDPQRCESGDRSAVCGVLGNECMNNNSTLDHLIA